MEFASDGRMRNEATLAFYEQLGFVNQGNTILSYAKYLWNILCTNVWVLYTRTYSL